MVPASNSDGVEFGSESIPVSVGVAVELVVVLVPGLDLLPARVVRVRVQLRGHLVPEFREKEKKKRNEIKGTKKSSTSTE